MSQTARLLLVIVLFWFTQYVYVPYTTPFLLAQKVSADFVGLVVGFYGAIPFFTRLFVGIFSDKIGYYKPMIIVGCASAAVASLIRLYTYRHGIFNCQYYFWLFLIHVDVLYSVPYQDFN